VQPRDLWAFATGASTASADYKINRAVPLLFGLTAISLAATEHVRDFWLARAANGKAIGAFALTEPDAGSDVAALKTTARAEDDAYVIDGRKRFISNAGVADFYTVFARTGTREDGRSEISAFVISARMPGFSVAERTEMLAPHPIGELEMRECRIAEQLGALDPERNHLGDERLVVGLVAFVAARNPGAERLLAKIAPRRELQERLDAGALQGDDVLALHAALCGRGGGCVAHEIGQASEIDLAVERHGVGLLVGQHVLAKRGAECGEPLDDGRQALLLVGTERRALAAMFGVKSIRREKQVDLIVTLRSWEEVPDVDRLGMEEEFVKILGVDIPQITIPVRPGRDLARLIEVAAFQTKLKASGYNPAKELNDRLITKMAQTSR
jgi:hypothetical protein